MLQVEDAAIGYDGTILSEPINLDIRRQEAIALVGPKWHRQIHFTKIDHPTAAFIRGKETLGTNVSIGYYDQGQAELHTNKTILAELWDEHPTVPEKDIRSIFRRFFVFW